MSKQQVLEQALRLDYDERAELAQQLLVSLEEPPEAENLERWLNVAAKRIEDLENGKVQAIAGEEALQRVRNRLLRVASRRAG